jgi:hypothetical protein
MKTPTALSVTSSQREQTSLQFQVPRLPRSNVCSTRDLENPSASVHLKRFSTPSLTLKFLCAGKLNPRLVSAGWRRGIRGVGGISAQSKFGSGPKWSHEGEHMHKSLIALVGAAGIGAVMVAPAPANADCVGCAVGAGILGGVAAGVKRCPAPP